MSEDNIPIPAFIEGIMAGWICHKCHKIMNEKLTFCYECTQKAIKEDFTTLILEDTNDIPL